MLQHACLNEVNRIGYRQSYRQNLHLNYCGFLPRELRAIRSFDLLFHYAWHGFVPCGVLDSAAIAQPGAFSSALVVWIGRSWDPFKPLSWLGKDQILATICFCQADVGCAEANPMAIGNQNR